MVAGSSERIAQYKTRAHEITQNSGRNFPTTPIFQRGQSLPQVKLHWFSNSRSEWTSKQITQ